MTASLDFSFSEDQLALREVADTVPALQGVDYDLLLQRADEQRRSVEEVRREAAVAAFVPRSE